MLQEGNSKIISTAAQCRYQLGNFWRRGAISKERKNVYEAIISAKLMYALDITSMPKGEKTD